MSWLPSRCRSEPSRVASKFDDGVPEGTVSRDQRNPTFQSGRSDRCVLLKSLRCGTGSAQLNRYSTTQDGRGSVTNDGQTPVENPCSTASRSPLSRSRHVRSRPTLGPRRSWTAMARTQHRRVRLCPPPNFDPLDPRQRSTYRLVRILCATSATIKSVLLSGYRTSAQCSLECVATVGGGATGTIRPSTSPRMPNVGFEVRRSIVRQRSPGFANVHFVVDRWGQQFAVVRHSSPQVAGVAVRAAVKAGEDTAGSSVRILPPQPSPSGAGGMTCPRATICPRSSLLPVPKSRDTLFRSQSAFTKRWDFSRWKQ